MRINVITKLTPDSLLPGYRDAVRYLPLMGQKNIPVRFVLSVPMPYVTSKIKYRSKAKRGKRCHIAERRQDRTSLGASVTRANIASRS